MRASAGSATVADQTAVLTQMTDSVLRLAERLVQPREVVVAVGEIRILGQCGLIGVERGGRIAQILQQYTLVEEQQCIGAGVSQSLPIDLGGLLRPALLVQQTAPVGPGRSITRVLVRGMAPGTQRGIRIVAFELQRLRKP